MYLVHLHAIVGRIVIASKTWFGFSCNLPKKIMASVLFSLSINYIFWSIFYKLCILLKLMHFSYVTFITFMHLSSVSYAILYFTVYYVVIRLR